MNKIKNFYLSHFYFFFLIYLIPLILNGNILKGQEPDDKNHFTPVKVNSLDYEYFTYQDKLYIPLGEKLYKERFEDYLSILVDDLKVEVDHALTPIKDCSSNNNEKKNYVVIDLKNQVFPLLDVSYLDLRKLPICKKNINKLNFLQTSVDKKVVEYDARKSITEEKSPHGFFARINDIYKKYDCEETSEILSWIVINALKNQFPLQKIQSLPYPSKVNFLKKLAEVILHIPSAEEIKFFLQYLSDSNLEIHDLAAIHQDMLFMWSSFGSALHHASDNYSYRPGFKEILFDHLFKNEKIHTQWSPEDFSLYLKHNHHLAEVYPLIKKYLHRIKDKNKFLQVVNEINKIEWSDMRPADQDYKHKLEELIIRKMSLYLDQKEFKTYAHDFSTDEEWKKTMLQSQQRPQPISIAYDHVCVLLNDDTLSCWGSASDRLTYVPQNLGKVRSVHVGNTFSCALLENDEIKCWGGNVDNFNVKPDYFGKVKALRAGSNHLCVVNAEDQVKCWGYLGDRIAVNPPKDMGKVFDVFLGRNHTCAILQNKQVNCWGRNTDKKLSPPQDLGLVQALALGEDHTCALKMDKSVKCWGDNDSKQLEPPLDLGPVKSVQAKGNYTCAITEKNLVRCWGENKDGALNIPQDLGEVHSLYLNTSGACAVTFNKQVKCWGKNRSGELRSESYHDKNLKAFKF